MGTRASPLAARSRNGYARIEHEPACSNTGVWNRAVPHAPHRLLRGFLLATVIAQHETAATDRRRVIAEVAMPVQSIDLINLRAAERMFWQLHDFYRHLLGLVPGNRPELSSTGARLYVDGRPKIHLMRLDAAAEPCFAAALNGSGLVTTSRCGVEVCRRSRAT